MDEKLELEMLGLLREIRERLAPPMRGPIYDPAPDWFCHHPKWPIPHVRGDIGDPGPVLQLDKARLAQLKVRQIDMAIADMKQQLELMQLHQKLLKEEYKI